MINQHLEQQIKENFQYEPTFEQDLAIKTLSEFLLNSNSSGICILRGYAGTGKTSLIGALVKTLEQLHQKTVLLAPTGRAAKVFSLYANHPAYTIHKKIYRQKSFSSDSTNFTLNENLHRHTLFLVDEASMISNEGLSGNFFGSGRLLDDLIQYIYCGTGCRLLLIGDCAQLPPVGATESPALNNSILQGYGLETWEMNLKQVMRQAEESGILWNATRLRQCMDTECLSTLPKIRLKGFADIRLMPGNELIDGLASCYGKDGIDETIVICRSNKRANLYNNGIRNSILYREDELNSGDKLMVAKNNYYWGKENKEINFIANGDIATIRRVRRTRDLYGFRFADLCLSFTDYDNIEIETTVLLDTLHAEAPALSRENSERLFQTILQDYADIGNAKERMKKMKEDPYYNALQVKYAYAITCHKAQGGQWKHVFLDQGYLTDDMLTPDYFHWLYTAFTRATETLYLVNYPKEQLET